MKESGLWQTTTVRSNWGLYDHLNYNCIYKFASLSFLPSIAHLPVRKYLHHGRRNRFLNQCIGYCIVCCLLQCRNARQPVPHGKRKVEKDKINSSRTDCTGVNGKLIVPESTQLNIVDPTRRTSCGRSFRSVLRSPSTNEKSFRGKRQKSLTISDTSQLYSR